jgi:hypothetical protein
MHTKLSSISAHAILPESEKAQSMSDPAQGESGRPSQVG